MIQLITRGQGKEKIELGRIEEYEERGSSLEVQVNVRKETARPSVDSTGRHGARVDKLPKMEGVGCGRGRRDHVHRPYKAFYFVLYLQTQRQNEKQTEKEG